MTNKTSYDNGNGKLIYIKTGQFIIALLTMVLIIAGSVWGLTTAYIDARLVSHTKDATTHADMRKTIDTNFVKLIGMDKKLDSLIVEVRAMRVEVQKLEGN